MAVRPDRHSFATIEAGSLSAVCGAKDGEVEDWRHAGRPFVVASARADDASDIVRLGLATPDKRRIGFSVSIAALRTLEAPPSLSDARSSAPAEWTPTIDAIERICGAAGIGVRVFGSLAWTHRTGVAFLRPGSDLDLLLSPTRCDPPRDAIRALLALDGAGPRLDGELVLPGGTAVPFREWAARPALVLAKGHGGARLLPIAEIDRLLGELPA